MIRDLRDVRELPSTDAPTPLGTDEERQFRSVLFSRIGKEIAEKGWARFPAYSREERARLIDIGRALSEHWGRTVRAEPEDECSMFFSLDVMGSPAEGNGTPGTARG